MTSRVRLPVVGTPIDVVDWDTALLSVFRWARSRESRVVCICNVHSVTTARDDETLRKAIASADMATPDGAPVAWLLRRLGAAKQARINGPDLLLRCCEAAQDRGESMYFYGASDQTLGLLVANLRHLFPRLTIAGTYSPPYHELTREEDEEIVSMINGSGAQIVWVGLGCPKQEKWMLAHRGRVNAVMIGVGAAFDYHAGTIRRAPPWMRNAGLEWLYRLASEPRRLWRRYLGTNTRFIMLAGRQLLTRR